MSEVCKNWTEWLRSTRFSYMDENQVNQTITWLGVVRDAVLNNANIKENDIVIDIGTGTGLLAFGAAEKLGAEGKIIFSDKFEDCLEDCKKFLETTTIKPQYEFLQSDSIDIKLPDNSVDKVLMRSVMVHVLDKQAVFNEIFRILKPGGIFSAFEPIMTTNTRYSDLVDPSAITDYEEFKNAENAIMTSQDDPITNFNQDTLAQNAENAGFQDGTINVESSSSSYIVQPNTVEQWFTSPPSPGTACMEEKLLKYFDQAKVDQYIHEIDNNLTGNMITVNTNVVLITLIKP